MSIPEKKVLQLNDIGRTLASTLTSALVGGGGAGLYASSLQGDPDETPEERKARITRAVLTGAILGSLSGATLPLGWKLFKPEEPSKFRKAVTAPMRGVVSHPFSAAGALGSWYTYQHLSDRVRTALKDLVRLRQHPQRQLFIGSELTNPPPLKEEKALQQIMKMIREQSTRGQYAEEVPVLARVFQNRAQVRPTELVEAIRTKNVAPVMDRLKTYFSLLARTPVKTRFIPSTPALALLGTAAIPLLTGALIDRAIRQ